MSGDPMTVIMLAESAQLRKDLSDALARISWADAEIEGLQKQCDNTEAKFLRLCKDFDARDAELKRVIATQRVIIDIAKNFVEQRGRYNTEIAYLRLVTALKSDIL